MTDQELHQRFILLRSQGATFRQIAQELNVATGTLVNWSRKFHFEIQNLRAIEMEALEDRLSATREKQAQALAEELSRVQAEIKQRDLTQVPTARLYTLEDLLRRRLQLVLGKIEFATPVDQMPADEYHPQIAEWNP